MRVTGGIMTYWLRRRLAGIKLPLQTLLDLLGSLDKYIVLYIVFKITFVCVCVWGGGRNETGGACILYVRVYSVCVYVRVCYRRDIRKPLHFISVSD